MKTLLSFTLAGVLAACGSAPPPPLPEGVTCSDEALASVNNDVPAKANPDSDEYSETYAIGWYIGHGCEPPANWNE